MKKQLYIAYGSNLNREQMEHRCPTAKPIAKSCLPGFKLVFQGFAFGAHANVIPAEGSEVPVVVWEIGPKDELFLDRYEGVAGGYYTKEYMQVDVNGEMKEALIYIMSPHGYGIPGDTYLNVIAEGYKDFELDIRALNDAVSEALRKVRREFRLKAQGATRW